MANDEFTQLKQEVNAAYEDINEFPLMDDYLFIQAINYLWALWCDFHLYISNPYIPPLNPPVIIPPEINPETKKREFVYTIVDHGYYFSTSRAEEMANGIRSMNKFNNTIEKMVNLLIERIKNTGEGGENNLNQEIQVMLQGNLFAKRKAFESILNLPWNVVVTNFEPGDWGERYMNIIQTMADKGYGAPKLSPRKVL